MIGIASAFIQKTGYCCGVSIVVMFNDRVYTSYIEDVYLLKVFI